MLYEALNVRYAYLHKHKRLFDLISKQYEAFSEDSKELLNGTFGEKSTLETANYGQIMRWICIRMVKLRKEGSEEVVDESHERYKYDTEPYPLTVIDGKTHLYRNDVPWKADFFTEINKLGYDASATVIVDPETKIVVDIKELRKEAYKNTLMGDYLKVVIAVDKKMIKNVFVNQKCVGSFWATNTTIGDIKKFIKLDDHYDLIFNGKLYEDCSTLSSISQEYEVYLCVHQITPNIILDGRYTVPSDLTDDFGKVIGIIEGIYPGRKVVLICGCQPPRDMKVKEVIKRFGDCRTGNLNLYFAESFVHVTLWPEEYKAMNECEPIVETYVKSEITLGNFVSEFARRIPRVRYAYYHEEKQENQENQEKQGNLKWVCTERDDVDNITYSSMTFWELKEWLKEEFEKKFNKKKEFNEIEFCLTERMDDTKAIERN